MGFIVHKQYRWPGGVIPYYFHPDARDEKRGDYFVSAMTRWATLVNKEAGRQIITFKEVDAAAEKVVQVEQVSVGTTAGCKAMAITVDTATTIAGEIKCKLAKDFENYPHEVGHIIGLCHEHMRADAKCEGECLVASKGYGTKRGVNAAMKKEREDAEAFGPYDINSIMHYTGQSSAFKVLYSTVPKGWLVAKPTRTAEEVLEGTWDPSPGDIKAVIQMYG